MACLDLLRHFGDSLLVSEALLQLVRMYLLVHGCGDPHAADSCSYEDNHGR
jgi:hypothetical protein